MEKVWLLIPALIFRIAIHVPLLPRSGKRGVSKVKAPLACAFFTHSDWEGAWPLALLGRRGPNEPPAALREPTCTRATDSSHCSKAIPFRTDHSQNSGVSYCFKLWKGSLKQSFENELWLENDSLPRDFCNFSSLWWFSQHFNVARNFIIWKLSS